MGTKSYDPKNWYWRVAGSTTQVYSSKTGNYVPVDDATYLAWVNDGGRATSIASEAELGEVLAPYALRPAAANVLDGYKESHANKLTIEVVAKILLWLVNEVRTLKGQAPITAQQFKTFVKGQL
jgi:hypothetical protein